MSEFKECPHCFEQILAKAIKCKHCHSMLKENSPNTSNSSTDTNPASKETITPPPLPSSSSPSPLLSESSSPSPPPPPPAPKAKANAPPSLPHQPHAPHAPHVPPKPKATTNPPPPPPSGGNTTVDQAGANLSNPPGIGAEALPGSYAYDYPKASIGKRFISYIVDGIVSIVSLIILVPIVLILVPTALGPIHLYIELDNWITPTFFEWFEWIGFFGILIGLGWMMVYTLIRDGFGNGQSIGKRTAGLKVVRLNDNKPCSKLDSLKRNVVAIGIGIILIWTPGINAFSGLVGPSTFYGWLFYFIIFIPGIHAFSGLVEPLIAVIDKKGWRLGDRLAKTQVIMLADYKPEQ